MPRYLTPVPYDATARRQYSFSRLTGQLHARPVGVDRSLLDADVSAEPPLDARGLGTLVHAVLAEIDFARPGDVTALVRRHAEEQLLRTDRLNELTELVGRFLASPRAAEMAASREVYRELEFLLAWPPGRYLQGFIDCLYCDAAGQWRIIDYKTNRVTAETLADVAAQYEMQMFVYGLAAERILKRPPVELVLYFLRPNLEYHFTWDAAARERVVRLVDDALPSS